VSNRPRRGPGAVAALLLLTLASLSCGEPPEASDRPQVAVTLPPLAWFVEALADGAVRVAILLPPRASPHAYEPTFAEVRSAQRAALLVEVGHPALPFERTALEAVRGDRSDLPVVDAADDAARREEDPHVWLSPRRARRMVPRIGAALRRILPGEAAALSRREADLDAKIDALDREIDERLRPYRGRAFFVQHPVWTAFAADYGLRQVALEEGHKEPDVRTLQARIAEARRARARVIFAQPQVPPASAELVAQEIGARVVMIDPLGRDWPGTLRAMTEALVEALGR
jgi:zinc transport system substrate-binding protein